MASTEGPLAELRTVNFLENVKPTKKSFTADTVSRSVWSFNVRALPKTQAHLQALIPEAERMDSVAQLIDLSEWRAWDPWRQLTEGAMTLSVWPYPAYLAGLESQGVEWVRNSAEVPYWVLQYEMDALQYVLASQSSGAV
jgi:hypothetical protein